MAMYLKYQKMESGMDTYKIKIEVDGKYETLKNYLLLKNF